MKVNKNYFENLDGLRFLCFLSVFLFHSFYTEYESIQSDAVYKFFKKDVFGNGNIGVNFFFVLSGFLITYLIIDEKINTGKINVIKFWIRRALRIWPLYFFCVFFGFVIFPWLKSAFGQVPNETADPLSYLTFTSNFDLIKKGLPDASILGVLWSVAIEEQFYLVWPILLLLLPVKHYWIPFLLVIVSSLTFRFFNDDALLYECHTLSCIGDMAIGAFGAWLVSVTGFKNRIVQMNRVLIVLLYLSFAAIFFFRDELFGEYFILRVVERSLIAFVILFIILEQNYAKASLFKMGSFKTITRLGTITYGLYCLHFIGILIVTTLSRKAGLNTHVYQVLVVETLLALLLTILIAALSYRYFERPFLRIKEKFSYLGK